LLTILCGQGRLVSKGGGVKNVQGHETRSSDFKMKGRKRSPNVFRMRLGRKKGYAVLFVRRRGEGHLERPENRAN